MIREQAQFDPDRPITTSHADRYGRTRLASVIAGYVEAVPPDTSTVFALTGAWGTGKSSVLNLVGNCLVEGTKVVRFNPWLFSGAEQLTSQFLRELSVQLGEDERLKDAGAKLEGYGTILEAGSFIPGFGAVAKLLQGIGKIADTSRGSVVDSRKSVEAALRASGQRVLVIVDDIDRLDAEEVQHVFKLVRLVADFPQVSYLLAFDRVRVESALEASGIDGTEYVAKIVQCVFEVPPVERSTLQTELLGRLDAVTQHRQTGLLHRDSWANILLEVVLPLIETPRDICRYVNTVVPTIDLMEEEVALEDLLALEAVRVFLPRTYCELQKIADMICYDENGHHRDPDTETLTGFVERSRRPRIAQALLHRCFPRTEEVFGNMSYSSGHRREWSRDRRVAMRSVLEALLRRRIAATEVPTRLVQSVARAFGDRGETSKLLSALGAPALEALIVRLWEHHEQVGETSYENGLAALLEAADRLRYGRTNGFFDLGADIHVIRLVLRVARSAPAGSHERTLRTLMETVHSFTWRLEVLRAFSTCYESRPSLVPESVANELSSLLKSEVKSSRPERLAEERKPGEVLEFALRLDDESYDPVIHHFIENPPLLLAILRGAVRERTSATLGSAVVEHEYLLPFPALLAMCGGDEDLLIECLTNALTVAPSQPDARLETAIQLTREHLAQVAAEPIGVEVDVQL